MQCNTHYKESDVIPINPTEPHELARLEERIKTLAQSGLTHSLKILPDKKSKKRKTAEGTETLPKSKKSKDSGIRNAGTAALTSRIMEDERMKSQQRKLEASDSIKSMFAKQRDPNQKGKDSDFMSRGY